MASKEQRAIKITGDNAEPVDGILHFTVYDSADRLKRALSALGLCWVLAVATLFIPIAHFILVPGFLIAGPVLATSRYRQAEAKEQAVGACPKCRAEIIVSLDANDKLPKWVYCPSCDAALQLVD